MVLHQLCRAVVREHLSPGDLMDLLATEEHIPVAMRPLIQSNLADVFWFLRLELDTDGKLDAKKLFTALIQAARQKQVVSDELLRARLELGDVLQEAGVVKDHADFHKRQVRLNTRMLYTQLKYNLFREESEGYSKLIAELSELPSAGGSTSTRGCKSATEVIQNLQSLIGYFDLDPNRVLDLVLEALEVRRGAQRRSAEPRAGREGGAEGRGPIAAVGSMRRYHACPRPRVAGGALTRRQPRARLALQSAIHSAHDRLQVQPVLGPRSVRASRLALRHVRPAPRAGVRVV